MINLRTIGLSVIISGIKGISKIIKKGIKTTSPVPLDSKSTTGGNAKQYDLFEYLQYNSVMDKVKEKILIKFKKTLTT